MTWPKRASQLPLVVAAGVVLLGGFLFGVAGLALGGFGPAWNVLAGIDSPFGKASWIAVPLSIFGYLLLPTFIGLAVGAGVERMVTARLISRAQATKHLSLLLDQDDDQGDGQD